MSGVKAHARMDGILYNKEQKQMATLPTIETILFEVYKSLCGSEYPSTKKSKFVHGDMKLDNHREMASSILEAIFEQLGMDAMAKYQATFPLENFVNAYKSVEQSTWSHGAEQHQINWYVLSHFLVPGIARLNAFWNTEESFDAGMPSGYFWYLPEIRQNGSKSELYMPVAQVLDWLLDLLDGSTEVLAAQREASLKSIDDKQDNVLRILYNWRGKGIPTVKMIKEIFSDRVQLDFSGTLSLKSNLTVAQQVQSVLDFARRKNLTAEQLRQEIPATSPGLLEKLLQGEGSKSENKRFIALMQERYSAPSTKTIRQRLLVARMVQDGYVRLVKALHSNVKPSNLNPNENKVLQLLEVYRYVYNLTIEAYGERGHASEAEENKWFEDHLPPWLSEGLLLSILPSRIQTANAEVAELLTDKFQALTGKESLESVWPCDGDNEEELINRELTRIAERTDKHDSRAKLAEMVSKGSPWRHLQAESRFQVISCLAQDESINNKAREAAGNRLNELATSPEEKLQCGLLFLHNNLNDKEYKRQKTCQKDVATVLDELEANQAYEFWRAPILQYRAKHELAQNNFDEAEELFRHALEACKERNFGSLQGEIARDCFALVVANNKVEPGTHQNFFRIMLANGVISGTSNLEPSIEDTSRELSSYFWEVLYRPYPTVKCNKPLADAEIKRTIRTLLQGSDAEVDSWIKHNKKKRLHMPTGESYLMMFIKLMNNAMKNPCTQELSIFVRTIRQIAIRLAQDAPQQINISDFKGQTPLMLVAESGDSEMLELLLRNGAKTDMQDYQGRGALIASIKSNNQASLDTLLNHECSTELVTIDGNSALHTAAWSANTYAIEQLLKRNPELIWKKNQNALTPLELLELFIENKQAHEALNRQLVNRTVTVAQLKEAAALIEVIAFTG
ncbi:ankyrin repeat domain-containing protein [Ferrimonas sediminicola]|uniref:Ankyrin repeat domain-containing protein n=1 Tax=Ferrimonas sediminicola TaxID=2569538 RepID=A0A4U1B6I4_9GAMM|nr:ankyrin repeat domain-containing protein [Ferrimonas sediminicola]TKB45991.1 ankyrin repeat domain-containing protein [Ferrimonas sediminicola]